MSLSEGVSTAGWYVADGQHSTLVAIDELVHQAVPRDDEHGLVLPLVKLIEVLLGVVPAGGGDDIELHVGVLDELEEEVEFAAGVGAGCRVEVCYEFQLGRVLDGPAAYLAQDVQLNPFEESLLDRACELDGFYAPAFFPKERFMLGKGDYFDFVDTLGGLLGVEANNVAHGYLVIPVLPLYSYKGLPNSDRQFLVGTSEHVLVTT